MDVRMNLAAQQTAFLNNMILSSNMSQAEKMQALQSLNTIFSVADWYERRNADVESSLKVKNREIDELAKRPSYEDCLADIKAVKRYYKHYLKTCPKKLPRANPIAFVGAHMWVQTLTMLQNKLSVMKNRRQDRAER